MELPWECEGRDDQRHELHVKEDLPGTEETVCTRCSVDERRRAYWQTVIGRAYLPSRFNLGRVPDNNVLAARRGGGCQIRRANPQITHQERRAFDADGWPNDVRARDRRPNSLNSIPR